MAANFNQVRRSPDGFTLVSMPSHAEGRATAKPSPKNCAKCQSTCSAILVFTKQSDPRSFHAAPTKNKLAVEA